MRSWAAQLGISRAWLKKLVREFQKDPSEMHRDCAIKARRKPFESCAAEGNPRMAGKKSGSSQSKVNGGANLGFEQKLWQAADKLRGHMDAAEYNHVVLDLISEQRNSFASRYCKISN